MLRINVLVVLGFIFCLDIVKSSPGDDGDDALLPIYKKQLDYTKLRVTHIPSPDLPYDQVCNWPKEKLAVICNLVIRRLRTDYQVYNNLYMNYLPYTFQKPCTDVKVWINLRNVLAHQTAVKCFARPAVMTLESSKKMAHFYQKIVMYPWTTGRVMVFECNEDENYCTLLKYIHNRLKRLRPTDGSLFYTPMPLGWKVVSDLYNILHPIHSTLNYYSKNPNNIVNLSGVLNLGLTQICYVALRAENYKLNKDFNESLMGRNSDRDPHELQATLRAPFIMFNLSVSITAYMCEHSIFEDTPFMNKYYVAAGPGDYSVILLKEVGNDNGLLRYEIIEIIEYLTRSYVFFYFHHSY